VVPFFALGSFFTTLVPLWIEYSGAPFTSKFSFCPHGSFLSLEISFIFSRESIAIPGFQSISGRPSPLGSIFFVHLQGSLFVSALPSSPRFHFHTTWFIFIHGSSFFCAILVSSLGFLFLCGSLLHLGFLQLGSLYVSLSFLLV
jgi:hypothetical protein